MQGVQFFVLNIVLSVIVTFLMLKMKIPAKGMLKESSQNPIFWLYVVHWIKTVGLYARIGVWETVDPRIVTLWFNCLGSLLVVLSSISPIQLLISKFSKNNYATITHRRRFLFCCVASVLHICALASSLSIALRDHERIDIILFVWRMWFFANLVVEVFFLLACLFIVTQTNANSLRSHLMITLYIRVATGVSIALKFTGFFARGQMEALHLGVMLMGMFGYHILRSQPSPGRLHRATNTAYAAISQATRRTDPVMVFSASPIIEEAADSATDRSRRPSPSTGTAHFQLVNTPRAVGIHLFVDDGVGVVPGNMVVL